MSPDVHDLAGIGLGPFNLGLAALTDAVPGLDAVFLDRRAEFSWHPGLLLDGARLQVPFLADLVTMVDPTSRWSFLNYLREHDRMFPFFFAERFHVPRREYDHYCAWVARSLPSCRFGAEVTAVSWDAGRAAFRVTHDGGELLARNVVLGVGTQPRVPAAFQPLLGKEICHAADYLPNLPALTDAADITVIGSGQSGAEVFLDLLRRQPDTGSRVRWLTRGQFAPMEYSKIGLEHFTPDYTSYFRGLDPSTKDRLVPAQWQLYKAVSADTLAEIQDLLYERTVGGDRVAAELTPHTEIRAVERIDGRYRLGCHEIQQDRSYTVDTDRVVLATGYAASVPPFLDPLGHLTHWDEHRRQRINADHRVELDPAVTGGLYVQNGELHTHGVGAPDLTLGAWRAATILNAVTGRTVHRLPERTAFTSFGAP
ncbi:MULTISPECIES: lysine N(6)-hydroxylase/L-ornithine N(5)-oxygenase family protein [unclassified Crossiella]|uniref:lysine N(6)-hydroxylase/L-ornithine N(5)-oxygenase family protein n=1 Tax=unclassified Crossiella TaxID=2620835 RepID=UPI001FFE3FA6|nr:MULTISPECIES: lysine N(6)-hydroxylase/L-ornithine N(5)-oxygenase family protein [unclassified Crossiella]MCK2239869.1 lysine N(6)-hydroxylase/L-ornithine N(5)-oxygenase family protein [Crossiella sp. S99.2]MCK2252577.1 lysine N(6)-hydroxylase/L-ornithine N(5)-oxygenase family protein [Crossiella sp. S99.1]